MKFVLELEKKINSIKSIYMVTKFAKNGVSHIRDAQLILAIKGRKKGRKERTRKEGKVMYTIHPTQLLGRYLTSRSSTP